MVGKSIKEALREIDTLMDDEEEMNDTLPSTKAKENSTASDFAALGTGWRRIIETKDTTNRHIPINYQRPSAFAHGSNRGWNRDARRDFSGRGSGRRAGFGGRHPKEPFSNRSSGFDSTALRTRSGLTSIQTQTVEVLNDPYLLGNTNLLFIINLREAPRKIILEPETILSGSKGVRKFLVDSFQLLQKDVHEFLPLLSRTPDIKQGFQAIISSRFYFDTSHQVSLLDFQTCLLPLLFILSHPSLEKSPLYTESNFLYSLARVALPSLFSDYLTCMTRALELKTFHSPGEKGAIFDSIFFPISFAQGFYPIVKFLEILFRRFQECARESENRKKVEKLELLILQWRGAFENGTLTHTKESKNAFEIVHAEFQRVRTLLQDTMDVTEQLKLLRNRERDAKLMKYEDIWKDPPIEPPRKLFDNDHVNYRDIQLVPTMEEILFEGGICLPGNLPFSPSAHWLEPGPERLLDTHFRLLRMDMVAKIRLNIRVFLEHLKKSSDVRCGRFKKNLEYQQADFMVYTNTRVMETCFDKFYGLCYAVSCDLPNLRPENVPRFNENQLQKDNLVCFICREFGAQHNFRIYFAVIASRDKKCLADPYFMPSRLEVHFAESNFDPLALRFGNVYMLEFKGLLYESYRPILLALQRLNQLDLPFVPVLCPPEPLSLGSSVVELPLYLQGQDVEYSFDFINNTFECSVRMGLIFSKVSGVNQLDIFCPKTSNVLDYSNYLAERTSLDKSQSFSLLSALTTNVCCIQGPPGTGKTFIGVQIVKSLLQIQFPRLRILLMSLTNHALDQFLCHLSNEGVENMLRISSVKNESLSKFDWASRHDTTEIFYELKGMRKSISKFQMRITELLEHLNDPVEQVELWNYLEINEVEISKQIESPLIYTGYMLNSRTYLDYWLQFKDPPSFKKEEPRKKREKKKKKNRALFDSLEIDDDFNEKINLDEVMGKLNESKLPDAEESMEAGDLDESAFEDAQPVPAKIRDPMGQNYNFSSDEMAWKQVEFYVTQISRRKNKVSASYDDEFENHEEWFDNRLKIHTDKSMWELELTERQTLINLWKERVLIKRKETCSNLQEELKSYIHQYHELLSASMNSKISDAQIIGITTTRASKYIDALKAWRPTIILCEEAGEILEAHILASLSNSVKQLILIGDHKQLRPRISEYDLSVESRKGQQYRLDVSLFERLMDPNFRLPLCILQEQRRMKPIISQFIRKTIYPELKDGADVMDRPSIRGMQKDVFFMTHNYPQNSSEEMFGTLGHSNDFEVEMITATIKYLLRQGYKADQIVVLTPYLSQVRLLRKKVSQLHESSEFQHQTSLSDEKNQMRVRVSTVDNYQGEESDIVLISLVRSTLEQGSDYGIGFLKVENRVNVLLSRARHGMYLFGNSPLLSRCSKMWKMILTTMEEQELIGEKLPILCQNHPEQRRDIQSPDDFEKLSPLGGCLENCTARLKCGHVCMQSCHYANQEHTLYKCMKPCELLFSECNHGCPKLCYEPCGKCQVIVDDIILPKCGHILKSPRCHVQLELESFLCPTMVELMRPCGHGKVNLRCHQDVEEYVKLHPCHEKVVHTRGCGHRFELSCYMDVERHLMSGKCQETVEHTRNCGHKIYLKCHEDAQEYMKSNSCSEDVESFTFRSCKHLYPRPKCYELGEILWISCYARVTKKLPCGHDALVYCHENPKSVICDDVCHKQRSCGHKCTGSCGNCYCEHPVYRSICRFRCKKKLPCFHVCNQNCGEHTSTEGSCPETSCKEHCLKTACVHQSCDQPCGKICQPCLLPCTWGCPHQGTCPYPCGYPCLRLPCDFQCTKVLKCGHFCPGVCGEICPSPTYCLECSLSSKSLDENQLEVLRSSKLAGAPLIFLKCGHFFPINVLDSSFKLSNYYEQNNNQWSSFKYPEHGEATFLSCPTCQHPVRVKDTYRYSRILKLAVIKRTDEMQFARFSSNLVHVATFISELEASTTASVSLEIKNIIAFVEERSNGIFGTASDELALNIIQSPILENFPNVPPYRLLLNSPQYLSLNGQYFVLKARLNHILAQSLLNCLSLVDFGKFRACMETVLELYNEADEFFYLSNAVTRQFQLIFERTYAQLDCFTSFLSFVTFGEFRRFDYRTKFYELKRAMGPIHKCLYNFSQMPDDLQKWKMTYLFRFFHLYSGRLYRLAKLLEMQLEILSGRGVANMKECFASVKTFLSEHASIPKFRMPFSSQDVNYSTDSYILLKCVKGHLYPVSRGKSRNLKNYRCLECGQPIVTD